ncbi:MAG: RidA family protein [Bacteroidota bacterium]|nr:RidA family protein [Bacteroidota bacterium]
MLKLSWDIAPTEDRRKISSGSQWEDNFGFSRAVRAGNLIEVSGTTALDSGRVFGAGDAYEQTRFILRRIERAVWQAGGRFEDIIRTRIYVTDIRDSEAIGRAHGEFFRDVRPASTLVEVRGLFLPELLVEIEATAYVPSGNKLQ